MQSPWLLSTATIQWWHVIFSVSSFLEHKSSLEENFLLSLFAVFLNVPKEKRQKSLEFQLLLHEKKKQKKKTSWGTGVDTRPQLSMTETSDIRPPFSWVVWWLHFRNWGYFEDTNNVASSKKPACSPSSLTASSGKLCCRFLTVPFTGAAERVLSLH